MFGTSNTFVYCSVRVEQPTACASTCVTFETHVTKEKAKHYIKRGKMELNFMQQISMHPCKLYQEALAASDTAHVMSTVLADGADIGRYIQKWELANSAIEKEN